jgi:undecaprenyl-diphosphatase
MDRLRVAVVVGLLQGVVEWLPVSSEGTVALYLSVVEGLPADAAVRYSLFLHAGTAVAALAYYRADVRDLLGGIGDSGGFGGARSVTDGDTGRAVASEARFLLAATLVSGAVGVTAYLALSELVSVVAGGVFVALVGGLLVVTGLVQRLAAGRLGTRERPTLPDAALVGLLQGLAVLPGVSRSGTTVSALLLRGYAGPAAFRLSFLLSIPAALGAGALAVLDAGLPTPGTAALLALLTSAVVGYATIDGLLRVVRRVAFWGVCVGLGSLAVLGGVLALL